MFGASDYDHGGMDPAREELLGERALIARHSGRLDVAEIAFSAVVATMEAVSGGPFRVQREQSMRAVLFVALVPRVGGGKPFRVLLGKYIDVGRLPLAVVGLRVAQVDTRRGYSHNASPVVAILHVVGVIGARWRAFLR